MATFFKNKVVNALGTVPTELIATTDNSKITVIGLSATNLTTAVVKFSITLTDDTSTTGYFVKDIILPPYQSARLVNGGEKLIMASGNNLRAFSDVIDSVDVIVSYVEIV
jgi:hypothetical protein